MAGEVGMRRHLAAMRDTRPDRHGFAGDGWGAHIEGAAGELAVAKALDRFWSGSVNTFHGPDGGDVGRVQVRTRSRHDYELLIRPSDPEGAAYVLVTGHVPEFWVRGWLWGFEAQRRDGWLRRHGDRPAAWFVPTAELRPVDQLAAWLEFGGKPDNASGEVNIHGAL